MLNNIKIQLTHIATCTFFRQSTDKNKNLKKKKVIYYVDTPHGCVRIRLDYFSCCRVKWVQLFKWTNICNSLALSNICFVLFFIWIQWSEYHMKEIEEPSRVKSVAGFKAVLFYNDNNINFVVANNKPEIFWKVSSYKNENEVDMNENELAYRWTTVELNFRFKIWSPSNQLQQKQWSTSTKTQLQVCRDKHRIWAA